MLLAGCALFVVVGFLLGWFWFNALAMIGLFFYCFVVGPVLVVRGSCLLVLLHPCLGLLRLGYVCAGAAGFLWVGPLLRCCVAGFVLFGLLVRSAASRGCSCCWLLFGMAVWLLCLLLISPSGLFVFSVLLLPAGVFLGMLGLVVCCWSFLLMVLLLGSRGLLLAIGLVVCFISAAGLSAGGFLARLLLGALGQVPLHGFCMAHAC